MITYPMTFKVSSKSHSGINSLWSTEALAMPSSNIQMAIPPEFEGPGNGYSPEDLYAIALQNCFIATFKVFAEKSKLQFDTIQVESDLIVDRDEKGRPWMAKIKMQATLIGSTNTENAKRILEKTSQSCMILNSVKTEKEFTFEIQ